MHGVKMNYKLLLTSHGIVPEIREYFLSLLSKKPEENNAVLITTAAYGESENPHWLERDRQSLYDCGIKNIEDLDLKEKSQGDLEKTLANKDVIFVSGGNSFYLLHWIRKSGFDKAVIDFLERGGLYVGASAGSYVACPTIEQAMWKRQDRNKVNITDLTALNLVPFLITAHFEEKYRDVIESATKRTQYPIVALTDKQAILIEKSGVKIVGEGRKEFWNRFKET
jgi:dipeptidase E